MLPSSQRLSVQQFNFVMEKGRVCHSTLFLLRVCKIDGKTRVSTVVPNRVAKKATERNHLRRKMYEAVAQLYKMTVPDQQVIVFAKSGAMTATFEQLTREMRGIFVKAGLLR